MDAPPDIQRTQTRLDRQNLRKWTRIYTYPWTRSEEITPHVTPPRAQAKEIETATETIPETSSPIPKPGRSRGRGTWRAPQKIAPGVGTRSKTRAAELEKRDNAQAQAAHARWPPSPDATVGIQKLTRELHISDVPRNVHKELQRVLPSVEEEEIIQVPRQPPVAGLMTRHQDTYYIPPLRAVGGARGSSAPVSMTTLGLIQRQDPSLAAQLREDPASMMTQATRHRVYSIMRLIRAGMLGQMASLQQWEDAMRRQDDVWNVWTLTLRSYEPVNNILCLHKDSTMPRAGCAAPLNISYSCISSKLIFRFWWAFITMSLHCIPAHTLFICVRYV